MYSFRSANIKKIKTLKIDSRRQQLHISTVNAQKAALFIMPFLSAPLFLFLFLCLSTLLWTVSVCFSLCILGLNPTIVSRVSANQKLKNGSSFFTSNFLDTNKHKNIQDTHTHTHTHTYIDGSCAVIVQVLTVVLHGGIGETH